MNMKKIIRILFMLALFVLPIVMVTPAAARDVATAQIETLANAGDLMLQPLSDVEEAEDIILDASGRIVGYFDKTLNEIQLNPLDENGAFAAKDMRLLGKANHSKPQRLVLYNHKNFRGHRSATYSDSRNKLIDLRGRTINNIASSMVIPPNCSATLYDGYGSGKLKSYNAKSRPQYIRYVGNLANNKISSVRVICQDSVNTFCGYGYIHANYDGRGLPFYKGHSRNISGVWGDHWNDMLSSFATNDDSDCDGLLLYTHATLDQDINQDTFWLDPDTDYPNLHSVSSLGDQVSRVLEVKQTAHKFEDASFKIGAMLYGSDNYGGKKYIYNRQGGDWDLNTIQYLVGYYPVARSFIVANDCFLIFRDLHDPGGDRTFPGGHYTAKYIPYTSITVGCSDKPQLINHQTTSHIYLPNDTVHDAYLIGRYNSDMQYILNELNYPVMDDININCNFPLSSGQSLNLLNESARVYNYYANNGGGGFFRQVNIPWLVSAEAKGKPIFVVTKVEGSIYRSNGALTGFGREVYYLEQRYNMRYDPVNDKMVKNLTAAFPRLTSLNDMSLTPQDMNYAC